MFADNQKSELRDTTVKIILNFWSGEKRIGEKRIGEKESVKKESQILKVVIVCSVNERRKVKCVTFSVTAATAAHG